MSRPSGRFNLQPSLAAASAALALVFLLTVLAVPAAPAQTETFRVIHHFTAGLDGSTPYAGLTIDRSGNLYGTSYYGGGGPCNDNFGIGCGTVFQLKHKESGWTLNPLYKFTGNGNNDGAYPAARVIFGPDGALYGTTIGGAGNGTVFNVRPSGTACISVLCPWKESVLYIFTGGADGAFPFLGDLVFDPAGTLYGTTIEGGFNGQGVVYKLSPSAGGWTQNVLYSMVAAISGYFPYGGVIFDRAGNLYGTASTGGAYNYGTVYQLTPSGASWTENTVYSFRNEGDGSVPISGLTLDQSGKLYGATAGVPGATVFELTPSSKWTLNVLYSFSANPNEGPYDGPNDRLLMDAAGNLYGTAYGGGAYGRGVVFELTPSDGGWTYTDLHDFSGNDDGAYPIGGVVQDANGNIYGTASEGGQYGGGVVWEITP